MFCTVHNVGQWADMNDILQMKNSTWCIRKDYSSCQKLIGVSPISSIGGKRWYRGYPQFALMFGVSENWRSSLEVSKSGTVCSRVKYLKMWNKCEKDPIGICKFLKLGNAMCSFAFCFGGSEIQNMRFVFFSFFGASFFKHKKTDCIFAFSNPVIWHGNISKT